MPLIDQVIASIEQARVIALLDANSIEDPGPTIRALRQGGIRSVELCYADEKVPATKVVAVSQSLADTMTIGLGVTGIDASEIPEAALESIQFLTANRLQPHVIEACHAHAVATICTGAVDHCCGSDFKSWPLSQWLERKTESPPSEDVRVILSDDVTLPKLRQALASGASAVRVGPALLAPQWVESRDFAAIKFSAEQWTFAAQAAERKT